MSVKYLKSFKEPTKNLKTLETLKKPLFLWATLKNVRKALKSRHKKKLYFHFDPENLFFEDQLAMTNLLFYYE